VVTVAITVIALGQTGPDPTRPDVDDGTGRG
jgi:hypothetical protein